MALALGSIHLPAASSRDESQAPCLFNHFKELGSFQGFLGLWSGEWVGKKSRVLLAQRFRREAGGRESPWKPVRL